VPAELVHVVSGQPARVGASAAQAWTFGQPALARVVASVSSAIAAQHSVARARVLVLVSLWLALTLGVGGQAAFYMRPFFGFPATRGNTPPFFLGAEPDVRGARNFYEAIAQTVWHPPLPRQWPKHER